VSADQDHRVGHAAGGPTTAANLAVLCRHDHRLKHDAGWTLHPNTDTGAGGDRSDGAEGAAGGDPAVVGVVWESPLGHQYQSRPPPVIVPVPDPHPDEQGRFTLPEDWYQRHTTPTCDCTSDCDCDPPPLLPDEQPADQTAGVTNQGEAGVDTAATASTGRTAGDTAGDSATPAESDDESPCYAPDDIPPF
jgi:hypothetical protein